MADVFTPEKRSRVMAAIHSRGNRSTELRLIELMRAAGVRGWRRGFKIFGHPDFVFPRERTVVFVDGCFWHGCPRCCRTPSTNSRFWLRKIGGNRRRDARVSRHLRNIGWAVIRIREHEIKRRGAGLPARLVAVLARRLGRHNDASSFSPAASASASSESR